MSEPITSSLLLGVAGNIATNVMQAHADRLKDTKTGRALAKLGLLKPGFEHRLENAITIATAAFLKDNPSYDISEVHSFLSSKSLGRDISAFLLDSKAIDIFKLSERMSTYIGVPLTESPDSWPNNIDPFDFITEFVNSLMKFLALSADESIMWLGAQLSEQKSILVDINRKLNRIDTAVSSGNSKFLKSDISDIDKECQEYESLYLGHLNKRFQKVTTPGARELHGLHQSLSVAYISLNIKSGSNPEPVRAETFLAQNSAVAIRGPAGSGKTTLLSWIVTRCANEADPVSDEWKNLIPFFVPLRKVARLEVGAPLVDRFVEYSVDEKLWTEEAPKGWLNRVLRKQKRAIVMIDGVDELPPSRRSDFWKWVEEFTSEYPGNRVIITSRALPGSPTDSFNTEQWNPPTSFVEAQLQDMSNSDVTKFVHHWHDAVDRSKLDDQEKISLEDARQSLPLKLEDTANRRIRDLCNTPLLCAMVCVLHWREEGYLPKYRVDLYDKCCEMLIEARDIKRGVAPPPGPLAALSKNDKEMVLQRLAIEMMNNRPDGDASADDSYRIEISREKAIAWIQPKIASFQTAEAREAKASQVLDFLVERTGLLREPATDLIDFPHRTFQEYLAACAAGADSQEDMLAKKADDDQWHETIMLAAGTTTGGVAFGRKLIEALIKRGERHTSPRIRQQNIRKTSFALALGCLENLKQQEPDLRDRVLSNLVELVPPRNEGDARILSVAGDAAVSHLSYLSWKDENTATVSACARALRLIGTTEAIKALERGYFQDIREAVVTEVCRTGAFEYTKIPSVSAYVKEHGRIPRFAPQTNLSLIKNLDGLKNLHIDASEAKFLSEISEFHQLEEITLERADVDGSDLSKIPKHVNSISLVNSFNLSPKWFENIPRLKNLRVISGKGFDNYQFLSGCSKVNDLLLFGHEFTDISPVSRITDLNKLRLISLSQISDIFSLKFLENLEDLHIQDCARLRDFSPINEINGLIKLSIQSTPGSALAFPIFKECGSLKNVYLSGVSGISDDSFLKNSSNLESITIHMSKDFQIIKEIETLINLKEVDIAHLPLSFDLNLGFLENLESFRCTSIASFSSKSLESLPDSLKILHIERCQNLDSLNTLGSCQYLQSLSISSLPKITNLDALRSLTSLTYLDLTNCDGIDSLQPLMGLPIEELYLRSMDSISDFSVISTLKNLKTVGFIGCDNLDDLSFLSDLTDIQRIWLLSEQSKIFIPEHLRPKIADGVPHNLNHGRWVGHRTWFTRDIFHRSNNRFMKPEYFFYNGDFVGLDD